MSKNNIEISNQLAKKDTKIENMNIKNGQTAQFHLLNSYMATNSEN